METKFTINPPLLIYQFTVKKLFENKFLISLYLISIMTLCSSSLFGQRYMENLDRGLIAMRTNTNSVLISWRIPGDEYTQNATYNLYRGSTLIASNLTVSNYVDTTSTDDSYRVAAVIGGTEQELSPATGIRGGDYFTIPVRSVNGGYDTHHLNDASVGDLDGDGEYEIVVKRLSNDESPTSPHNHYLEAYELDGTFMWAIDLGPNLLHAVEVNFLVYDLDNDGKAEIATRTSDGMIDGLGNNIGDRDGDGQTNYRSTAAQNGPFWFRTEGPDYISIFDGETGAEIAWDSYIALAPIAQWGRPGQNLSQLGHRATKTMLAVAYLDGVNPSLVISRGIYERIKLEAWNFGNGTLTQEWAWDSSPGGVATAYHGQGNHNLAAGDVDGDGRDEITYGAMAVDENGNGLYSTGFGHGDAAHLADINPDLPGLEYFSCQENANGTTVPGLALRNAETGTIQWASWSSGDIGRCMAADVDPNYYGMEIWGSDGSGLRSSTGELISNAVPTTAGNGFSYNFGVWWDGDVQREILDRTVITKWNGSGTDRVATLYNLAPISDNNSSKSNPALMADILGDWREEVIYRRNDNTALVVFVSPHPTNQRMYTLMHDPNYRLAVAWQNNSYNQPPNLGFYFGGGMDEPPAPNIQLVNACTPTAIIPFVGIDGGELAQVNEVLINPGSSVTLSPQSGDGGTWSWSGCDTSGSSREQTINPTQSCVATVIYTNDSGCVSTSNFTVTIKDDLPHDNFSVGVTNATCVGSSNGSIAVSAVDPDFTYNVAISGQEDFTLSGENGYAHEITGLSTGEYDICFTIEGEEDYKQCYTVHIGEPAPLTAVAMVDPHAKSVNLSMTGSNLYRINLNGEEFVTTESNLDLSLKTGMNSIEVSTGLSCQDTYSQEIFVSEEARAYPNPTEDWVQIYVGGMDNLVQVVLNDAKGHQYFAREFEIPSSRVIEINLSKYSTGVYFIGVQSKTVKSSLRVIKH